MCAHAKVECYVFYPSNKLINSFVLVAFFQLKTTPAAPPAPPQQPVVPPSSQPAVLQTKPEPPPYVVCILCNLPDSVKSKL